jgi:hypothetical protein
VNALDTILVFCNTYVLLLLLLLGLGLPQAHLLC